MRSYACAGGGARPTASLHQALRTAHLTSRNVLFQHRGESGVPPFCPSHSWRGFPCLQVLAPIDLLEKLPFSWVLSRWDDIPKAIGLDVADGRIGMLYVSWHGEHLDNSDSHTTYLDREFESYRGTGEM